MENQHSTDLRLFRIWMKASQAFFGNIHADIESHHISKEHFVLLELLYSKGPQPVQKISESLGIASGSITYVLDKLTHKGLVERKQDKEDKRVYNIALTASGKKLFDEMFPEHIETIAANLAFISDEEKEELTRLLKKIGLGAKALAEKNDK